MGCAPGRYELRACVVVPVILCTMLILPIAGTLIAPPQARQAIQPPDPKPGIALAPGAGITGDPGSGWVPDVLASWLAPSGIRGNASIGANRTGTVLATYERYDSSIHRYGICTSFSADGGMFWDHASCYGAGFEDFSHPSIAVNFTGGEGLVLFEGSGGGLRMIYEFPHMGSGTVNLTTDPRDHNPSITISRDSSANAFLAFERDDGAGGTDLMFMAARDAGVWKAWETPQTLVGGLDNSVNTMPRVAWSALNNVYIVYEREAASGNRDVFMMRSATGGTPGSWTSDPGTPVAATASDEFAGDVAAVSNTGKVVVAYTRHDGAFKQIHVAYSENWGSASSWKNTTVTGEPINHENPRVVAVPAAGAVRLAYWSPSGVFASTARAVSLSSWTSPVRISDREARMTAEYSLPAIADYLYAGSWYTGVVWTDGRLGPARRDIYYTTNSPKFFIPSPDLAPTSIEILPRPPLSNNTLAQVNVTVANLGNTSVGDFDLLLFDDRNGDMKPEAGENISLSQSPGIASFSQTNILLAWNASPEGNHSLCAYADPPPSKVDETNENNNVACMSVRVVSMPDYVPTGPLPAATVKTGLSLSVQFSIQVLNQGDKNASSAATIAFYNESSPTIPFAAFTVPPLKRSETSSRFTATWLSPATPGNRQVTADVDYHDNVTELNETNNNYTWSIEVMAAPNTSLAIGQPNYTSSLTYVTSSTPLSLKAISQAGSGIAFTEYRVDDGNWLNYTSPFFIPGDGAHAVEYRSADLLGNLEATRSALLVVDDTPPASTFHVGTPSFTGVGTWITSSTDLAITAVEQATANATFTTRWQNLTVFNEPIGNNESFVDYLARVNLTVAREIWPGLSSVKFHISGRGCFDIDLGVFLDANGDGKRQASEFVGYDAGPTSEESVLLNRPAPGLYILAIAGYDVSPGGCFVDVNSAQDFGGPASSGLAGLTYRVFSLGSWSTPRQYSSPFRIAGEGVAYVEYYSRDNIGNVEATLNATLHVDNTPPASALVVGDPKYLVGGSFVNSSTPLALSAVDAGVGMNSTFYRLWGGSWSSWREYTTPFTLTRRDGTWFVEFLSYDYLGNREGVENETLTLDDTPPATTILPATGPYTTATVFDFTATDAGCGVNYTMYRVDGAGWNNFTTGFTLSEGGHTISFYSMDNLNNTETERSVEVNVTSTPPPSVEANYKPVVAVMFAIILAVAGVWSSKRRPWKGGKDGMAVTKAFMITSFPFIVAEAASGIVSLLTGQLSMPPLLGLGTAVDMGVLVSGLAVTVVRATKMKP